MIRSYLAIAMAVAFTFPLTADSIPTLTETTGTAHADFVPGIGFSISTPSFDMTGGARGLNSVLVIPGTPLTHLGPFPLTELLGPPIKPSGTVRIGGTSTSVFYGGDGSAMALFDDTLAPSVTSTLTFPATLTGSYTACVQFPPPMGLQFPCQGVPASDLVANVSFTLPGLLFVHFSKESAPVGEIAATISFSTIPEPANVLLVFLGVVAVIWFTKREHLKWRL